MTRKIYKFGDFRLDPAARELWFGNEEQALPPKAFGCLVYLIENRDRAVSRDELIGAVWDKKYLADSVLGRAISIIRHSLGDDNGEPRFIKTARSYGYRWVAPVEIQEVPDRKTDNSRFRTAWWVLTVLVLSGSLAAGFFYLRQTAPVAVVSENSRQREAGDIALILPIIAESEERHRWIRFGVMDLIAERLQAAGQAMVPSETVIGLMRGDMAAAPEEEELNRLTAITGARLLLLGEAESTDGKWRVSIRSIGDDTPLLSAYGEAENVIEAARTAADRMALYLGLMPLPDPDTEPDLAMLLQQIQAARLAQRMELARDLIQSTDPVLRRHPKVRHQWGGLAFYDYRLDDAQAEVESLLDEVSAEDDPMFRARLLVSLSAVRLERGSGENAAPILQEAIELFSGREISEGAGIAWEQLGIVALRGGNFDLAREHYAMARMIYQGIGDALHLAGLDLNVGVLEQRRERSASALHYFTRAAERRFVMQDLGGELLARAYMMRTYLSLLDPESALRLEPRLSELLSQTTNPQLRAIGTLSRIELFDATGQHNAANVLLQEVLADTRGGNTLRLYQLQARVKSAEYALREGNARHAMEVAAEVVEHLNAGYDDRMAESTRGQAWLTLVRACLAADEIVSAAAAVAAMGEWSGRSNTDSARIHAALGEAELAIREGHSGVVESAFERAFEIARAGQVPAYLLEAIRSYVGWLLDEHAPRGTDPGVALMLADYLSEYADRHYDAALVQLRTYHALGSTAAWRIVLARAVALAGERQIPPELLVSPHAL